MKRQRLRIPKGTHGEGSELRGSLMDSDSGSQDRAYAAVQALIHAWGRTAAENARIWRGIEAYEDERESDND